ncbi:uncharacterized protein [Nicotiana tomentosiformis]|uniref:uncharacterized protein n=1 Tax=Nicotiana tomentosiformis TaxID=4098 RepID=UPI00388C38C3
MDPLKYIFQKPVPTGKLAKWQILLSEFDIIYVTQKAIKGQALADHLEENPIDGEYESLKMYFPNEEVSFVGEDITETYDGWRMFFDGAANFKGVGIGAFLVSETVFIPAEVEIPSLRIIQEAELSDEEWIRSCYEQMALINGKRMNAVCHSQLYQNRMSRAFNKRDRTRQFTPGQLVLKRIFPHQDEAKGKFSPNWQGPYMVHIVLT